MEIDITLLAVLTPLVAALVQAIRQVPGLAKHTGWLPLISVGVGLVLSGVYILAWSTLPLPQKAAFAAIHGIAAGLGASGLYSLVVSPVVERIRNG